MSKIAPSTTNVVYDIHFSESGAVNNNGSGSITLKEPAVCKYVKDTEFGDFVMAGNNSGYMNTIGLNNWGSQTTIEFWLYVKDNKRACGIVSQNRGGCGIYIYMNANNTINFDDGHRRASANLTNGWHHIALCVFWNGNQRYFIDGKHVGTYGCSGHGWSSNPSDILIGKAYGQNALSEGMKLGWLRIYNTAKWSTSFDVNSVWVPQHIGLAISKTALNFTNNNVVNMIDIAGSEPADTKRRFAFKIGDKYVKLDTDGNAVNLATQAITVNSVLTEGNTAAELTALTNIPAFVGKMVYPVVALYAPHTANVMPSAGISVRAGANTAQYTKTEYSQEYHLSDSPVFVVSALADVATTGGAKVDVTTRIKSDGSWGNYMALADVGMKRATDIQFRANYSVTTLDGSDTAKLNSATVTYTSGTAITNGVTTDIVTTTQHFTNNLSYVYALVKHKDLMDAKIKAFVSLRDKPGNVNMKHVGYGTGERNTYQLEESGINQSTLVVYLDGKVTEDYSYNTETSQITLNAERDAVITASYEFGWSAAEWVEMSYEETQINDSGDFTSRYSYEIPSGEQAKTVTAIKYQLIRPEGKVENDDLGIATGKRQIIQLPHFAKKETIKCNGSWSYEHENRLLTVVADEGTRINISYDYIAESPEVYAVIAGWTD